ncbi:hypothetical protein LRR80_01761 [Streptomyces sp. RO-S4]|uniref:hypothetical protein n=1 Tax=unclassified Streptomyces TaxID=2593676 RepID=UPI0035A95F9E|nr:hypothetical protein [Streptomyces sp. RO-S4]
MDTQNPNAPSRAQSAADRDPTRSRHHTGGVIHDNTRHTTRFTVIGNHLTQHPELSLLAIGLGCHIQSLPTGTPADIKSLAARFKEGTTRIAAALRELETHGYLRHKLRTCDTCDRAFRAPETETHCRDCRPATTTHR